MNLEKVYYDTEGNKYNILHLVKKEPEWAANRIQEGERYKAMWEDLKATYKQVICPPKTGDLEVMRLIEEKYGS
jgi:hypothetical protein